MGRGTSNRTPLSAAPPRGSTDDALRRACADVDEWLAEREANGRPGHRWLRLVADEALAAYAALSTSWAQQDRRDIRAARAALLAADERVAVRAAAASAKPFSPYELASASTPRERDDVWEALLPAGVELRELRQLKNRAARAAQLPVARPRR